MGNVSDLFKAYDAAGSIRLGLGERTDAAGEVARLKAQDAFLRALQEEAPAVMDELYAPHIVEAYFRWDVRFRELIKERIRTEDGITFEDMYDDPEAGPFMRLSIEWCEKWNLRAHWFLKAAQLWLFDRHELLTGAIWSAEYDYDGLPSVMLGESLEELVRAPGPRLLFAGEEYGEPTIWPLEVFPVDPETGDDGSPWFDWNPATESRSENEARAVAYFKARYRAAQDARLEEAEERYPGRVQTRSYDHFRWLVQYQVLRWTYAEVARKAYKSRQTAADAIRDTAALIDLPLREPDRPGRKRNRPDLTGIPASEET